MNTRDISYQVFEELNDLRRNPSLYTSKLRNLLSMYKGNLIHRSDGPMIRTQEGPTAVEECIACLERATPLPEFTWSDPLSRAAQDHCNDCGPAGHFGHTGFNGSTMGQRIEKHCSWGITIGENIGYGYDTAEDIVLQLIVDDGVPGRGHRINIMKPEFEFIGVGFGPHTAMRTICTMDFAGSVSSNLNSGSQKVGYGARPQEIIHSGDSHFGSISSSPRTPVVSNQVHVVKVMTQTETQTVGRKTIEKVTKTTHKSDGSVETTQEIKEYYK